MFNKPSDYNKIIVPVKDKTLGYLYFMDKQHPLSSKIGRVWHHRHVASVVLGRWVQDDELVHHVDEDRSNNIPDNLKITNARDHILEHDLPRKGRLARCFRDVDYIVVVKCYYCGINIRRRESVINKYNTSYCISCRPSKIVWPSDDELRILVWQKPRTQLAVEFGVSDKAIAKRCNKIGISMPPRGYWTKQQYKNSY